MALFPLEEVHFQLNEGGSPKRVVFRPCMCEMCWPCSRRLLGAAPLAYPARCRLPINDWAVPLSTVAQGMHVLEPGVIYHQVSDSLFGFSCVITHTDPFSWRDHTLFMPFITHSIKYNTLQTCTEITTSFFSNHKLALLTNAGGVFGKS